MLFPAPLGPTRPIISPGRIVRLMSSRIRPVAVAGTRRRGSSTSPLSRPGWTGRAGSATLGWRSRISKMRWALAAARWVAWTIRLIDSSRM